MISVCIATYNGERYIKQQLISIIAQLSEGDEIVVSDDASTDGTLSVIRSMGSPLIHIYEHVSEHGYTANFENALRHAKGDYIFLADQDDVWLPQKVKTCMQYLQDYYFVVSDAYLTDEQLNIKNSSFYAIRHPHHTFLGNVVKFGYLGCCMAFRREVLDMALPFPSNRKFCTHDNWIFLVASAFYKTYICEEKLIYYRRHKGTTSSGGIKNSTNTIFKIRYRIYLIKHIFIRRLKNKRHI